MPNLKCLILVAGDDIVSELRAKHSSKSAGDCTPSDLPTMVAPRRRSISSAVATVVPSSIGNDDNMGKFYVLSDYIYIYMYLH